MFLSALREWNPWKGSCLCLGRGGCELLTSWRRVLR